MSELIYRNYVLSSQDFMVLSACMGIERIPVLFENGSEKLSSEELDAVIFQLYQREILCWGEGGSFSWKPEIRELFQCIKCAEKELQIYPCEGNPLLCFCKEYTVVTELSKNDKGRMKLHGVEKREFFLELCERSILPERDSREMDDSMRREKEQYWRNFIRELPMETYRKSGRAAELRDLLKEGHEIMSLFRVYDRKTEGEQRILWIQEDGIADFIVYITGDSVYTEFYSLDRLEELLFL